MTLIVFEGIIAANCSPDLYFNTFFTVAVKCLNFEMLFDPFEEELDLPSFLVEPCYR